MGKIYNTKSDNNILKILRKKIGMTQLEVATKLNLVTSTISKWETGKTIPDQSILPELAKLYNCSIDCLLGNTENIKKEPIENSSIDPRFVNALNDKGITVDDINKLSSEQMSLVTALLDQFCQKK